MKLSQQLFKIADTLYATEASTFAKHVLRTFKAQFPDVQLADEDGNYLHEETDRVKLQSSSFKELLEIRMENVGFSALFVESNWTAVTLGDLARKVKKDLEN